MKDILVVVDMQKDFIDGALGSPQAQALVGPVVEKIRHFQGDIYYTRDTHGENYLETLEGQNLPVIHCVEYTEGWRIHPDIMAASEGKKVVVIDKPAFGSMELLRIMEEEIWNPVGSITLVGLCTDICVISNALMLRSRFCQIPICVDASCCAGATLEGHQEALNAMERCHIQIIGR
ncbi:cysteine hydrolase [Aminipila butyrica]|uniref:Cysteine hydrolase n=1 Tax=Aminipila butyrica TaxID=433296 RepID=A0A858BU78_9FIRM|nr:isochorismatase family cysteine hydrolase [Aminipila butyrica]QIB69127.1 cysteine hydrolase [Aminipila butyrica]